MAGDDDSASDDVPMVAGAPPRLGAMLDPPSSSSEEEEEGGKRPAAPPPRKRRRVVEESASSSSSEDEVSSDESEDEGAEPVTIGGEAVGQGMISQQQIMRHCLLCRTDDPTESRVHILAWKELASTDVDPIEACGGVDQALQMLRLISQRLVFANMAALPPELPLQMAAVQHSCDIFGVGVNTSVPVPLVVMLHQLILFRVHRLVMAVFEGLRRDSLVLQHTDMGERVAADHAAARERLENEVKDMYIRITKALYAAAQVLTHTNLMLGCMLKEHTISSTCPPTAWILLNEHPDAMDMPKEMRAQMRLLELLFKHNYRRMGDLVMEEVVVEHPANQTMYHTHAWRKKFTILEFVETHTAMSYNTSLWLDRGPRTTQTLVNILKDCVSTLFPALIVQQGVYSCQDCVMDLLSEKMQFHFFNGACPRVRRLLGVVEESIAQHKEVVEECAVRIDNYDQLCNALLQELQQQVERLEAQEAKRAALQQAVEKLRVSSDLPAVIYDRARRDEVLLGRQVEVAETAVEESRARVVGVLRGELQDGGDGGCRQLLELLVERLDGDGSGWRAELRSVLEALRIMAEYTARCKVATQHSLDFLTDLVCVGTPPSGMTAELYRDQRFPFEAFGAFCRPPGKQCVECSSMSEGLAVPRLQPWLRTCASSALGVDWRTIETPLWEKIFTDQELPQDAVDWFAYVWTGRMIYPPRLYDSAQISKMVSGAAGTGKGIQQGIEKSLHESPDDEATHFGILMSTIENPFGPSQVLGTRPEAKAFACHCPDVTPELARNFPTGALLIWISNERGRWPVKNETPLWGEAPHTSWYSNGAMPHKDKGGNIVRRLVIMLCKKVVKKTVTTLEKDILRNWVQLVIKSAFAYRSWADRVRGQGPWNKGVLPQYCHDTQDLLRSMKWPIMSFLRSADQNTVLLDTTANRDIDDPEERVRGFMSMRKLQSLVKQYVAENKYFSPVDWTDTSMVEQSLSRLNCSIVVPNTCSEGSLPETMNPRSTSRWVLGVQLFDGGVNDMDEDDMIQGGDAM